MSARPIINRAIRFFAQVFAAGICPACGCELNHRKAFCQPCSQRLKRVDNPCPQCGLPCSKPGQICAKCLLNPPRWQKMIAPYRYQGLVRDCLIQLKFNQSDYLARSLCVDSLDEFYAQPPQPEVLIPVPLHPDRLVERGFNQALEIARVWSRQFDLPIDRKALTRIRATASQSGLSAQKREKNLIKAFAYAADQGYRHVAIVDDIVTTASTINEITKVLHRGGVEFVEVWALARVCKD